MPDVITRVTVQQVLVEVDKAKRRIEKIRKVVGTGHGDPNELVRDVLREMDRQIDAIGRLLEGKRPAEVIIDHPPLPQPPAVDDCGKFLKWAEDWLSTHPGEGS